MHTKIALEISFLRTEFTKIIRNEIFRLSIHNSQPCGKVKGKVVPVIN
jgi:hypothetical protein